MIVRFCTEKFYIYRHIRPDKDEPVLLAVPEYQKYNKKGKIDITHFIPIEIIQLNIEGNIIAEYPSLTEAERQTGVSRQNIRRNARGRNTYAGGFIWKYKQ